MNTPGGLRGEGGNGADEGWVKGGYVWLRVERTAFHVVLRSGAVQSHVCLTSAS